MKWKDNWKVIDEKPIDGGQGAVLKVRKLNSDEVGALKIMHTSQIGSSKRRERFKKEAEALSRLSNSTTPNLLEFNEGSESQEPYFISDWIEGTTLDAHTQNKPIQIEDAISIVRSLAKTLDEAHQNGIVHRDIKCANLLVDQTGIVKLADFGCSKLLAGISVNKTMLGTPYFMAPEVIMQTGHSFPADVWSFACAIIEMLTTFQLLHMQNSTHLPGNYDQFA